MFFEDLPRLTETITRRMSLMKSVFKLSAKAKDASGRERYWNILDVYEGAAEVYQRRVQQQM